MVSNIIYYYINKRKSYIKNIRCNVYSEYIYDFFDIKIKRKSITTGINYLWWNYHDNRPATRDIDCVFSEVNQKLLAMKILASRPEPAKDFIDAFILCRDLNIRTREELLKVVEKYLPLTLIGERQIRFIKYLGEDLGYDWK